MCILLFCFCSYDVTYVLLMCRFFVLRVTVLSVSQSQSQSVCLSWCLASCLKVTVLSIWGALSDEKSGLSFVDCFCSPGSVFIQNVERVCCHLVLISCIALNIALCVSMSSRPRWPRGVRHEPSSPAPTLE
jgi:hypothetical protein